MRGVLATQRRARFTSLGLGLTHVARFLDPTKRSRYTADQIVTRWYRPPEVRRSLGTMVVGDAVGPLVVGGKRKMTGTG